MSGSVLIAAAAFYLFSLPSKLEGYWSPNEGQSYVLAFRPDGSIVRYGPVCRSYRMSAFGDGNWTELSHGDHVHNYAMSSDQEGWTGNLVLTGSTLLWISDLAKTGDKPVELHRVPSWTVSDWWRQLDHALFK